RLEGMDGFLRAGHVGALRHVAAAVVDQVARVLDTELVLRRAGQGDVGLYAPGALLGVELGIEVLAVLLDATASGQPDFLDTGEALFVEAGRIVDEAAG